MFARVKPRIQSRNYPQHPPLDYHTPILRRQGIDPVGIHQSLLDAGTKDTVWIPQIARESDWVVITTDRGRRSAVTEKLPKICRAYGVTHVTLSRGLHRRNMYYKALAIQSHGEKLLELENVARGAGYTIKMTGKHFNIAQVTDSPPASEILDPAAPLRQLELPGQ